MISIVISIVRSFLYGYLSEFEFYFLNKGFIITIIIIIIIIINIIIIIIIIIVVIIITITFYKNDNIKDRKIMSQML